MSRIRSLQTVGLALALFALLAWALSASAWPGGGPGKGPGGGGPGPHGHFFERQLDALGLPAETRAKVQAVLDQSRTAGSELHEQIRAAHESMQALLEKDPVDEAAVMAQADALGALTNQARKQRLATLIQVRNLLTPEQRAQLEKQMQEHREHRWHGMKGGQECPGAAGAPAGSGAAPPPPAQRGAVRSLRSAARRTLPASSRSGVETNSRLRGIL
jgi:Spy/CpxP family protein refolding chaperone